MARVNGTALVGRLAYTRRYFGQPALTQVLAALVDRDAAANLEQNGALRGSWYPFELFIDLSECIDRVCGKGDRALVRAMAAQVAEDDLNTVYKVFFRFASPFFILSKASQLWHQYYDSGEMHVIENLPGHGHMEIVDFETPHRTHCESVAGWAQRSIEMTGKREVQVNIEACRADNGVRCLFNLNWQE